jgi:hypothetical protein
MMGKEVGAGAVQMGNIRALFIQSDLVPSDCYLFPKSKKSLAGQIVSSDQETKDVVLD